MLRFIVYRYISYKDSKISHASLLTLHHHLSQLPQPYYPPHCPTTCPCPTPSPTTHLTTPRPARALLHPALRPVPALPPAHDLLHRALLPTTQPHDLSLPYHQHLPYSLPYDLYTTSPSTRLSIPDPPTLPMCTLLPYLLVHSHRLHILSCTPHTRATLPTALPISPTDVPCRPHIL